MKILVTGSSGLVGTALVSALARGGHTMCRLVRPQSAGGEGAREGFAVAWNPATGELGGAGVGIDTTRALVGALAKMNARPSVLVSASAIGYYGDRGSETLTEESKPGSEFLAGLAQEWEAEALKAEALGIRVVLARFGIILAREGGALPKMMMPFKFGAGGKLGSGQQWMSWVTLEDVVGILRFAIENASVRGAMNIVSPQPLQNAEFTKALARAMHRPALFPAPAFALRLALGEMADALLLSSQRVLPQVLEKLGYRFLLPDLSSALVAILAAK